MLKNSIHTILRLGIVFGCAWLVAFWGYELLYPDSSLHNQLRLRPIRRELPIFTKQISLSHNKYGNYLVGLLARHNKDYARMARSFERALKDDPENTSLKKTVYLSKAVQGDISDVLTLAKDLNPLKQSELLTDYILIANAFKNKDYTAAEQLLSEKPPYGPDRILKPALAAWIKVGQGNRSEAERALEPLNHPKARPLYYYYRAMLALAFRDQDAAETAFRQMRENLINGYPSLTAVALMRDFYQRRNQWKAGQPDYDQVQTFLNDTPPVAEILDTLKAPKEITPQIGAAVTFYDVSVALAPLKLAETSLVLNALALYLAPEATTPKIWEGELLETTGNHRAANEVYRQIRPESDMILVKIVMNLITEEQYADTIPLLKKLIQNNPQDGYLHMLLGDSFLQTKDYPAAIQAYETAVRILKQEKKNNLTGQALFMLGAAYDNAKQGDKAEKNLLEALHYTPNDPQALNYLGYLWLDKRKNIDEAFEMVDKAARLRPDDPNIMDSLALGYYLKKDYSKALELAEKSTDKISYSSVAYTHLGDIYAALNRHREARYQYRKALDLNADLTPELKAELKQKLNLTR